MAGLFKVFLIASSLCLICAVFLVNQKVNFVAELHPYLANTPRLVSYVTYFFIAVIIAGDSIFLARFLDGDSISKNSLSIIEPANDAYLPIYLGYFFVALSIQDSTVFIFVFGIIYTFTFYSSVTYFNPMYFLFGYRFYYVVNKTGIKVLIITRRELKDPAAVEFKNINRINNFTFIDIEEDDK